MNNGKVLALRFSIFWHVTPCSPLNVNGRFGGTFHLHLKGRRKIPWFPPVFTLVSCLVYSSNLKMEAKCIFRNVDWHPTDCTALYNHKTDFFKAKWCSGDAVPLILKLGIRCKYSASSSGCFTPGESNLGCWITEWVLPLYRRDAHPPECSVTLVTVCETMTTSHKFLPWRWSKLWYIVRQW
jgi:hypothetical protein